MDSASDFGSEGCGFESHRLRLMTGCCRHPFCVLAASKENGREKQAKDAQIFCVGEVPILATQEMET